LGYIFRIFTTQVSISFRRNHSAHLITEIPCSVERS
jgi:hypothetical protein